MNSSSKLALKKAIQKFENAEYGSPSRIEAIIVDIHRQILHLPEIGRDEAMLQLSRCQKACNRVFEFPPTKNVGIRFCALLLALTKAYGRAIRPFGNIAFPGMIKAIHINEKNESEEAMKYVKTFNGTLKQMLHCQGIALRTVCEVFSDCLETDADYAYCTACLLAIGVENARLEELQACMTSILCLTRIISLCPEYTVFEYGLRIIKHLETHQLLNECMHILENSTENIFEEYFRYNPDSKLSSVGDAAVSATLVHESRESSQEMPMSNIPEPFRPLASPQVRKEVRQQPAAVSKKETPGSATKRLKPSSSRELLLAQWKKEQLEKKLDRLQIDEIEDKTQDLATQYCRHGVSITRQSSTPLADSSVILTSLTNQTPPATVIPARRNVSPLVPQRPASEKQIRAMQYQQNRLGPRLRQLMGRPNDIFAKEDEMEEDEDNQHPENDEEEEVELKEKKVSTQLAEFTDNQQEEEEAAKAGGSMPSWNKIEIGKTTALSLDSTLEAMQQDSSLLIDADHVIYYPLNKKKLMEEPQETMQKEEEQRRFLSFSIVSTIGYSILRILLFVGIALVLLNPSVPFELEEYVVQFQNLSTIYLQDQFCTIPETELLTLAETEFKKRAELTAFDHEIQQLTHNLQQAKHQLAVTEGELKSAFISLKESSKQQILQLKEFYKTKKEELREEYTAETWLLLNHYKVAKEKAMIQKKENAMKKKAAQTQSIINKRSSKPQMEPMPAVPARKKRKANVLLGLLGVLLIVGGFFLPRWLQSKAEKRSRTEDEEESAREEEEEEEEESDIDDWLHSALDRQDDFEEEAIPKSSTLDSSNWS